MGGWGRDWHVMTVDAREKRWRHQMTRDKQRMGFPIPLYWHHWHVTSRGRGYPPSNGVIGSSLEHFARPKISATLLTSFIPAFLECFIGSHFQLKPGTSYEFNRGDHIVKFASAWTFWKFGPKNYGSRVIPVLPIQLHPSPFGRRRHGEHL